jgi:competence protein ComEC
MTNSQILLFSSVSFIFGIFTSSFFKIQPLLLFLVLFLFSIFLFLRQNSLLFFLFSLLFCFGFLYFQTESLKIEKEIKKISEKEELEIKGILASPPDRREKFQNLKIKIISVSNEKNKFSGKVLVKTSKHQNFKYGDEVIISGKFSQPKVYPEFNLRNYLLKDKTLGIFYFPKIKKTGKNYGNFIFKNTFSLKEKIEQNIQKLFENPHSGLLEALLFGQERNIPQDLKEKLNLTNTRHIAAVSGMNVTIISVLVLNFFLSLGLWRQHAFYLTLLLIFFYVLMIGFPSSAIRAAIMGILFLTAQYFGRFSSASRTIYLAGALMLLINPFLLKYDIGFQLSFLATLGLIYLYSILLQFFKDVPKIFGFRQNLAATLSAQIFVFPLLLHNFGKFSPIFIFPNVLILPVLPLTTILAFLVSILSFLSFSLAKFFSFAVLFFSTYILKIIDFFSTFPAFEFQKLSLSFLVLSYFILGIFTFYLNKRFGEPYFLR